MPSNTTLVPSIISKESLFILENNMVMASKVNRKFENQFAKIGTTLTIRKPNRFLVSTGPALQIQDVSEPSTSVTITTQAHVDFQFTMQDLTLVIEEFSERYIKPGMARIVVQKHRSICRMILHWMQRIHCYTLPIAKLVV